MQGSDAETFADEDTESHLVKRGSPGQSQDWRQILWHKVGFLSVASLPTGFLWDLACSHKDTPLECQRLNSGMWKDQGIQGLALLAGSLLGAPPPPQRLGWDILFKKNFVLRDSGLFECNKSGWYTIRVMSKAYGMISFWKRKKSDCIVGYFHSINFPCPIQMSDTHTDTH